MAKAEATNDNDLPFQDDDNILPVIGLGGSAGSIGALQDFFAHIPPDLGIAYVVVIHLSPDHESSLAQVLAVHTSMPVVQVNDTVELRANCVYVIPPSHHLSMQKGSIHLTQPQQEAGKRVAVDLFFRTLAVTHRSRAVAVVLSGMDGDGAIGIKRVKEAGGVTVAQDPTEAEHEGMPRSAIETGMVDWILPVKLIAAKVTEWIDNENRIKLPPAREVGTPSEDGDEVALREILAFVQSRTGNDFVHYKRATVLRRIGRRLQVNSLENLPQYINFLRTHPGEAGALLQDLLISVTNFFRDPESFQALDTFLPRLFHDRAPSEPIRVWVPGCATGEEAYSLAMLLDEYASTLSSAPEVQIFATDLDEEALRVAREGTYPGTIAADVSPERLRRYFVLDQGRYRVKKEVRERVLFAPHNVLQDAPFSRVDLVTCRNLLIYFNRQAQERVFQVFHFALKPGGLLFLGGSESADDSNLFVVQNRAHRIYERHAISRSQMALPNLIAPRLLRAVDVVRPRYLSPPTPPIARSGVPTLSYSELHLKLLEQAAPPSVLVDANYDLVHLSERAGQFLRVVAGEMSSNLLAMVDPALRMELRVALFRAVQSGEEVIVPSLSVEMNGQTRLLRLRVRPMRDEEYQSDLSTFLLVIFEDVPVDTQHENIPSPSPTPSTPEQSEAMRSLEAELEHLKSYLRSSVEQYETAAEELKASNEEFQAMAEEQRSAAEELETSREEIQAGNEELTTVNSELKAKIEELGRSNSDLQNLMSATDIATVFLSRDLHIKRYTPPAVALFHFIPTDTGRPVADLKHDFNDERFIEDAAQVLRTLVPLEREIGTRDGRTFLVRILPYRTIQDYIDGVVLTFIDITQRKRAEEGLHESEEQFRRAIEEAPIPVIMHAEDGEVLQISRTWTELTGYTAQDVPTVEAWLSRAYGEGANEVRTHMQELFAGNTRTSDVEFLIRTQAGEDRHWSFSASSPGILHDGRRFIVGMAVDITERARVADALREREERLRLVVESVNEYAIITLDPQGIITGWNSGAERTFGWTRSEAVGQHVRLIFTPEDTQAGAPEEEIQTALREGRARDERWHARKDGSRLFMSGVLSPFPDGTQDGFVKIARDLTRQQQAEAAVRASEARFRTLSDAVPQIIWTNDASGVANYFNSRWFEYSGLSLDASVGPGWQAIVHPDDAPASVERWNAAMAMGEVFDTEYRLRRADGQYRWFIGRNVPLRDNEGQVFGWFGSATDIEELKEAQHALQASEERQRIAIDAGELATWDWDVVADKIHWNERHFLLFGMTPREGLIEANEFISHVHPDDRDRVWLHLTEAVESAGAFEAEFRIVREDNGQVRWMNGYGRTTQADGGRSTRMSGVMFDSTERHEAQEVLRRSYQELEVRVEERTVELSNALEQIQGLVKRVVNTQEEERGRISRELHDNLGQYLTAIMLGLQALETQISTTGKQQESMAQLTNLRTLVDGLMKAAHRQAWELRPAELDAMGLEAALGQYTRDWSKRAGIEVEFRSDGWQRRPDKEIETTFYRVTQEALTNVARHARATYVSVALESNEDTVSVVVEDDGIGFDPDQSTGRLGVLGMRERMVLIGGTLEIESILLEGTTIIARVTM